MTHTKGLPTALVAAALLASASYANTLSYGAAWDDTRFVFASGATEGVAAIPGMFSHPLVRDIPAGRGAYRPITGSSYALDWSLGGGQASFFHWTNAALHGAVTALVLLLLAGLGAPLAAAFGGALVFAVHPIHVEAVASLAGRAELLAALFVLAATVVYVYGTRSDPHGAKHPPRLAFKPLVAILLLFAGALGSKENGIVLPVLLVALELIRPGARGSPVRRLMRGWPLWLGLVGVASGYMMLRRSVLGTFTTWDVAPYIAVLPTPMRITTAIANWGQYARLHFFPLDLSVEYGPALIMPASVADPRFWIGALIGALSLVAAVLAYRRQRLAALGLAWFVIAVLPVSNLLVPIAQWLAERFFYLPSVGLSMAVAALLASVPSRLSSRELRLAITGGVFVLGLLAARTWTRNRSWADTGTVVATLIEEHPESFRSQWFLGRLYFEQGRLDPAFAALDRATALNPNTIQLPLERGEWLLRLGRVEEAEAAMRALPAGWHADREGFLVRALAMQGRSAEADSVLAAARIAFPTNPRLAALADSLSTARSPRGDSIR